jgi:hypothetical protein
MLPITGGADMQNTRSNSGIKKLTRKYRTLFRIPENLNHYSKKDLYAAERKFLKFALEDGIYLVNRTSPTDGSYST